jgi:hypothetical protein
MDESKKFNITKGESQKKYLQGEKQNTPTLQRGISLFTLKLYFCECFNGHLLQSAGYESLICVRKYSNFKPVSQVVLWDSISPVFLNGVWVDYASISHSAPKMYTLKKVLCGHLLTKWYKINYLTLLKEEKKIVTFLIDESFLI